jgi:hypothetical protein
MRRVLVPRVIVYSLCTDVMALYSLEDQRNRGVLAALCSLLVWCLTSFPLIRPPLRLIDQEKKIFEC